VVGVRVTAESPFASRVSVAVTPNLSGGVARAVDAAIERLRDPTAPKPSASAVSIPADTLCGVCAERDDPR
jgi:hypothetical protein